MVKQNFQNFQMHKNHKRQNQTSTNNNNNNGFYNNKQLTIDNLPKFRQKKVKLCYYSLAVFFL